MTSIIGTDVRVLSREHTAYCKECDWKRQANNDEPWHAASTLASIHAEQTGHRTHAITRELLEYTAK